MKGYGSLTASRLTGLVLLVLILGITQVYVSDDDYWWRNAWWDAQHRMLPRERGDPDGAKAVVVTTGLPAAVAVG